jgi:thioredoxin 1
MNIDEHPARAAELGVLSIPTVILFEGGERQETVVGARPRSYFEEKFGRWL